MAAPLIATEMSGELAGDWKVFTSSTIEVMLPTLESSALLLRRTISHWRSRERGKSGAAPVKRLTGAAAMPWASSSSRRRRYLSSVGMGEVEMCRSAGETEYRSADTPSHRYADT